MVMRFDPFRELDRLIERGPTGARGAPRSVPMDAYRRGDQVIVELDLPGVDPDEIELTAERNVLTVRAERSFEGQEADQVFVAERPEGTFTRQLFLGESLDPEQISADYDRGVLRLTVPVAEAAKPRRIEVSGGGSGPQTIEARGGGQGS